MTLVLPAAAQQRVWVALAEDGEPYAEAAAVLKADLADGTLVVSGEWRGLLDERIGAPDIIVTVGVAALNGTLDWLAQRDARDTTWSRVPVLAILLPRAAYEAQLARHDISGKAKGRRAVSAALLDQPLGRQMALLKRALPERQRVGVLPGAQTRPLLGALDKEARAAGLKLVVAPEVNGPDDLYPSLKEALGSADVILALPEPAVYHGASLQNILLTTYRARVPLVAFSAAYVKAGAVLAVYSTPAQVARRAAEMVRIWLGSHSLLSPQLPREFAVAVNARVAASLGLRIDDAAVIAEDLRRLEARP
jgi:hypothetical protein